MDYQKTIGRLQEIAARTTEGTKQVQKMSTSAKRAYDDCLLHVVPVELAGTTFTGISFSELQQGNYVESGLDKDRPQKTYAKADVVGLFTDPPLREVGMQKVQPQLIVNVNYTKTKFMIMQFGSCDEAKDYLEATSVGLKSFLMDTLVNISPEKVAKTLGESINETKSHLDLSLQKFIEQEAFIVEPIPSGEAIFACLPLLNIYEYRMWWRVHHQPNVFSVYDTEQKEAHRRGRMLLDVFRYYSPRISTTERNKLTIETMEQRARWQRESEMKNLALANTVRGIIERKLLGLNAVVEGRAVLLEKFQFQLFNPACLEDMRKEGKVGVSKDGRYWLKVDSPRLMCSSCKKFYNAAEIESTCIVCGLPICNECKSICSICGREYGKEHATKCDRCGKTVCASCVKIKGVIRKSTVCPLCV